VVRSMRVLSLFFPPHFKDRSIVYFLLPNFMIKKMGLENQ
jgi:hypothetical protein